jgi:pseudouridine-5'-phosphate glycosidase/pseudouridine kinase
MPFPDEANKITLTGYKGEKWKNSSVRSSFGHVSSSQADVLVAGSLAIDLLCDYVPSTPSMISSRDPAPHTSNPANMSQSLGGVGQNIATTLHYLKIPVKFCSMVGDDLAGNSALSLLADRGLRLDGIEIRKDAARTAQYVAFNTADKELAMAMADMTILETNQPLFKDIWKAHIEECMPRWVILDANWSSTAIKDWRAAANAVGAKMAYEPVSIEKSCRIFEGSVNCSSGQFHGQLADLVTPNEAELRSMYHFIHGGKGTKIEGCDDLSLADMSVGLLPFFKCILTKRGSRGVLLTEILHKHDPRRWTPQIQAHLYKKPNPLGVDGVVYVREFPPAETVPQREVISVNGAGDTFMGVMIAGLTLDESKVTDDLVMIAQKGACMSIRSKGSVSSEVSILKSLL